MERAAHGTRLGGAVLGICLAVIGLVALAACGGAGGTSVVASATATSAVASATATPAAPSTTTVASSAGGASKTASRPCPSASLVNTMLGEHASAPVATRTTYSEICTYPGSGLVATKITFQADTASQFATDEDAARSAGAHIVSVPGLGQAAWTTTLGDLYVFVGNEQIKILAPLTATAKLESLARKLLI